MVLLDRTRRAWLCVSALAFAGIVNIAFATLLFWWWWTHGFHLLGEGNEATIGIFAAGIALLTATLLDPYWHRMYFRVYVQAVTLTQFASLLAVRLVRSAALMCLLPLATYGVERCIYWLVPPEMATLRDGFALVGFVMVLPVAILIHGIAKKLAEKEAPAGNADSTVRGQPLRSLEDAQAELAELERRDAEGK